MPISIPFALVAGEVAASLHWHAVKIPYAEQVHEHILLFYRWSASASLCNFAISGIATRPLLRNHINDGYRFRRESTILIKINICADNMSDEVNPASDIMHQHHNRPARWFPANVCCCTREYSFVCAERPPCSDDKPRQSQHAALIRLVVCYYYLGSPFCVRSVLLSTTDGRSRRCI